MVRRLARTAVLLGPLGLAACGGGARLGPWTSLECAPYASAVTGMELRGNAAAWWTEATGRYERRRWPVPGSVLVFRAIGRMPAGHVAVVRRVVSPREILVDQANWVPHRIGRADPVVDVSADNDWSAVRVWWAPVGALGITTYPTAGFVGPGPDARVAALRAR
ncbi:MAG TPA: CHAP domain-containing protein [Acetobacteraceae bacterium]|nr:CHAP domain-containing protein [Acetobacteraceae bacterium]